MTDYMKDDIDAHLMHKLKEIVPELRRQIEESIRNRLQTQLLKIKEQKKRELNNYYEQQIKDKIQENNLALKQQLSGLVQVIYELKNQLGNNKPKKLTAQQQKQFINDTVQEILNEQSLLQQVKNKLRPKIEAKVKMALQQEVQEGIEAIKNELQSKMQQERQQWVKERIQFWKGQADMQLQQLAMQHSQILSKKQGIYATLNAKKLQKKQAEQRWQKIMQNNGLISKLRYQLKQLKKQNKK